MDDETYDHSEAPIGWDGETPSPEIIARVRADIAESLCDLEKPEDLGFHTVFLSDDMEGPIVTLFGTEGGGFVAVYTEAAEWEPISELDV